jgi:hypothetical protein
MTPAWVWEGGVVGGEEPNAVGEASRPVAAEPFSLLIVDDSEMLTGAQRRLNFSVGRITG